VGERGGGRAQTEGKTHRGKHKKKQFKEGQDSTRVSRRGGGRGKKKGAKVEKSTKKKTSMVHVYNSGKSKCTAMGSQLGDKWGRGSQKLTGGGVIRWANLFNTKRRGERDGVGGMKRERRRWGVVQRKKE